MNSKKKMTIFGASLAGLACQFAVAQPTSPVEEGDIAFGLSRSDANLTLELVRGGSLEYNWLSTTWVQSAEFDNLGGNTHNGRGNLLGMNFGDNVNGATLWSIATNGTDNASIIYQFDGTGGELLTRGGGLSVSTGNTKVAMIGYDSGALNILDYTAGDGSGNGSASLNVEESAFAAAGATQGTTWASDDIVLCALLSFTIGEVDVVSYEVSTGNDNTLATITGLAGGSQFTDIDFNTAVSPYVYVTHSSFDNGTTNTLVIYDPSDWSEVNRVDLSTSCDTLREISLGFNNEEPALFMSMYGGDDNDPGPYIDVLDLSNPGSIADNSSVDYYRSTVDSSFNGIDYALTAVPGDPGDCISLAIDQLVAGQTTAFSVSNLNPGQKAAIVWGTNFGSTNGSAFGYCYEFGINGVNQSRLIGQPTANGSGVATFNQFIPGGLSGFDVLFQAAAQGTCPDSCMSNILDETVQ